MHVVTRAAQAQLLSAQTYMLSLETARRLGGHVSPNKKAKGLDV
jgi:hypothetical protein